MAILYVHNYALKESDIRLGLKQLAICSLLCRRPYELIRGVYIGGGKLTEENLKPSNTNCIQRNWASEKTG